MVIERLCPICHKRIWGGTKPKWRDICLGHDEKELLRKQCTICDSPYHYKTFCPKASHKPIATRSAINKTGRVGKATQAAVAKWAKTQKPNHAGLYTCYICGIQVPYLMAEHVKSKVRHPELRTDPTNLKPVCSICNRLKGSHDN